MELQFKIDRSHIAQSVMDFEVFLMYYYRLYSLDADTNHFIDVQDFRANGDAAAILKVGNPVVGVNRELWSLGRKVMDFAR